jgi:hypothetical protein
MGHQRLGDIPKTQRWDAVVATVGLGRLRAGPSVELPQFVATIADRTLEATEAGLERAIDDTGLRFTFYLLTQIVLAAREADWRAELRQVGVSIDESASLFDFTDAVQQAIETYVRRHGGPTDISEMAQQSAGQALAELAGPDAITLFGSGSAEAQDAVRRLSTRAGFSRLGQRFFGCFVARFLNFYLSRITAGEVGRPSLEHSGELSRFNEVLLTHCNQSARIVHDFCGEWYSKTEFQKGISLANTSGFMAVAVRKLQAELRRQREGV